MVMRLQLYIQCSTLEGPEAFSYNIVATKTSDVAAKQDKIISTLQKTGAELQLLAND